MYPLKAPSSLHLAIIPHERPVQENQNPGAGPTRLCVQPKSKVLNSAGVEAEKKALSEERAGIAWLGEDTS